MKSFHVASYPSLESPGTHATSLRLPRVIAFYVPRVPQTHEQYAKFDPISHHLDLQTACRALVGFSNSIAAMWIEPHGPTPTETEPSADARLNFRSATITRSHAIYA